MNRICVIANGYPSEYFVANAFVETLVNEMVDQGVQCTVIALQSLTKVLAGKEKKLPYRRFRATPAGNQVEVITPKYFSLSAKKIGPLNTAEITLHNAKIAAEHAFCKLNSERHFDAVYGHFIFESGIIANYLGHKYGIPAFFAYGENTTYTIDRLGAKKTRKLLSGITGVISVSTENKRVLIKNDLVPADKIGVFPNSVDIKSFYPRDRMAMRKELGFPQDKFIVAFVGRFLDVKGSNRLSAALDLLNDDSIFSIFIGDGPLKPSCHNILHCGPLQHNEIPKYLSAADVFVLPTRAEGCCNAIVEAMACGLPVISSDLPFNNDILDLECSVMVDSTNVKKIAESIRNIYQDSHFRLTLAKSALKKAQQFSINNRALAIMEFMKKTI